jgi:glycosyltransferase involved in cell wall biosynthesis
MELSLVICTRNRAPQLREALANLARLRSAVPWELVVVDNGSTDDTALVIDRLRHQSHPCVVKVTQPRPGLGNARNAGWRVARGTWVAFTDDDCYPADDYLESVASCFREDPRLGFVGGRILLFDRTDYPITIRENTVRKEIRQGEFIQAGLIQGANLACRREALESIGGFDPRFGAGALFPCEDVDVLARMSARGWHGAYDPRPLVYHHHGRKTPADAARLMKQYDRGRGAYYVKCLLDPRLRRAYARNWYGRMRRQPVGTTLRELAAGAEFLVRSALQAESGLASALPE